MPKIDSPLNCRVRTTAIWYKDWAIYWLVPDPVIVPGLRAKIRGLIRTSKEKETGTSQVQENGNFPPFFQKSSFFIEIKLE